MNRRDFTAGVVTGIALTSGGIILVNKVGSEATNPTELLRQIAERTLGMSGFQLSGVEYESTLAELEAMLVESVSSQPDAFSSVSALQAALLVPPTRAPPATLSLFAGTELNQQGRH